MTFLNYINLSSTTAVTMNKENVIYLNLIKKKIPKIDGNSYKNYSLYWDVSRHDDNLWGLCWLHWTSLNKIIWYYGNFEHGSGKSFTIIFVYFLFNHFFFAKYKHFVVYLWYIIPIDNNEQWNIYKSLKAL